MSSSSEASSTPASSQPSAPASGVATHMNFKSIGEVLSAAVGGDAADQSASPSAKLTNNVDVTTSSTENTSSSSSSAVDGAAAATEDGAHEEHEHEGEEEEEESPRITYEAGGQVTVLKSLCMACREEGKTRLLMTRIPFFRDVILMAFECEHCGYRNSEVQNAEVQEKGCHYEVKVRTQRDMNRQIVKGDKGSVIIPELDLEIPSITQAGVFTTVEGVLDRAIENLSTSQPVRRALDPPAADAVELFLVRLKSLREGNAFPFTLILDDPSGNSFLENPLAPKHDPNLKIRHYTRTKAQNEELGLAAGNSRLGAVAEAEEEAAAAEAAVEEAASGTGPAAAGAGAASEADDTTDGGFQGSTAATVFPNTKEDVAAATAAYKDTIAASQHAATQRRINPRQMPRDMSGNVPGGFKKGGALISNRIQTERSVLTTEGRTRASAVRDASGGLMALWFDSSSTDSAKEVMRFPQDCFNCSDKGEVRMCVTDVPHFKEVIIMSFACDECGWKNVEVKGGGAVPPFGTFHELTYIPDTDHSEEDMRRDVIKGDTAAVEIPELEIELQPGTLGGMYSTVEGLISAIRERLDDTDPFGTAGGDSGDTRRHGRMAEVVDGLAKCMRGEMAFTLRIRDPMANTWIYSPYAPPEDEDGKVVAAHMGSDPFLKVEHYKRSEDEDGELGLLDMNAPRDDDDDGTEVAAVAVAEGAPAPAAAGGSGE